MDESQVHDEMPKAKKVRYLHESVDDWETRYLGVNHRWGKLSYKIAQHLLARDSTLAPCSIHQFADQKGWSRRIFFFKAGKRFHGKTLPLK